MKIRILYYAFKFNSEIMYELSGKDYYDNIVPVALFKIKLK